MANVYWIGGNGTWSQSATTHWSTSSGGAGGATAPGSADIAIVDINSGQPTIEVSQNLEFNQLTFGTDVSFEGVRATLNTNGYTLNMYGGTKSVIYIATEKVTLNLSTSELAFLGNESRTKWGHDNQSNCMINSENAKFTLAGSASGLVIDPSLALKIGTVSITGENCYFKVAGEGS